jgi:hypothetical protein
MPLPSALPLMLLALGLADRVLLFPFFSFLSFFLSLHSLSLSLSLLLLFFFFLRRPSASSGDAGGRAEWPSGRAAASLPALVVRVVAAARAAGVVGEVSGDPQRLP